MSLIVEIRGLVWRGIQRCMSILLFVLCTAGSQHSIAAENEAFKSILIIYGSQDFSLWGQEFNESLLNSIPTDTSVRVTLDFLPLGRSGPEELQAIAEALRDRRRSLNPDLIVGVLPAGSSFLHEWGDTFAADATRVYVLPSVEKTNEIYQSGSRLVLETGIEDAAIGTLQIMPQLLPNLEQVFVLGGSAPADISYFSRVVSAISDSSLELEFTYLQGLTPSELVDFLADAPENSAILLSTYDTDHEGRVFRTGFIPSLLNIETTLPIFALYNSVMKVGGVLGGNITSAALYGEKTADLVMSQLFGEISADTSSPATSYVFDALQLNRFGINRNLLPPGSELINDDQALWRQYLPVILIGTFIIFLQLALIIALLRSMRRRKKAEEELRQTHKMEALGNLSGGVAHDFNNVLMAIVGNAEIANIYMDDKPDLAKDHLDKVLTASNRAKSLVTQILMFSRHSEEEDLNSISLQDLLTESIALIRASSSKHTNIEVLCADDLWNVRANPTQIQQVLMNLSNNAQHAMKEQGTISIIARNQNISAAKTIFQTTLPVGEYVAISISDTGIGISKENISRIFEPFFTTKTQGEGTGLGLALVYGIVKAHGGYLDIQSALGKGTMFTIYLRANMEDVDEHVQNAEEKISQGDNELILLVDDDEMVIDAIKGILIQQGYSVEAFTKPVDALREFREDPDKYNLVISDLSMPEMDGVRLISNIREVRGDIPAMLCTGYIDSLNQSDAEKLSNFTILSKPCSMSEIAAATSNALKLAKQSRAA